MARLNAELELWRVFAHDLTADYLPCHHFEDNKVLESGAKKDVAAQKRACKKSQIKSSQF